MFAYIGRRILQIIPTMFVISLIVFILLAMKPGDPLDDLRRGNPGFTQADYERLAKIYGLDQPWYVRYWYWLYGILGRPSIGQNEEGQIVFSLSSPDFGPSRSYGRPAGTYVFYHRLPNTLILSGFALFLAFIIAIPAGILSALKQHTIADYVITILNFIGVSIPVFWLGIMLIYLFAVVCQQCLPAGSMVSPGVKIPDWETIAARVEASGGTLDGNALYWQGVWEVIVDRVRHLILPVFALSVLQMAAWTRFMRSSVLEVLNLDYIRTAKAKGLSQRKVIFRHVFRNAILPIITLIGLAVPLTMSGAVLTETVFNWPGMGRAVFDAILNNDFNVAMASLMFISLFVVLFSLISDIAYALIDPRIRYD